MMFKFFYFLGQYFRNPSLHRWFYWLKKSERWSVAELEEYQLKKLKEITHVAYHHSSFYKNFYQQHHFHPDDIKTLDDIAKIPILTKSLLIANQAPIHTNLKFNKVHKATTSGSSGQSLQFWRDESADSFNRASIRRGYSWYGVNPWDFSGYFWGFNFTFWQKLKTRGLDFLQNRIRIFTYSQQELNKFVHQLSKASYISGYSSMIYESAKLMNQQQLSKPSRLKLVVGTSEKILDSYQNEVEKAFGSRIINEYGATESGIIGFECPEGNIHINMEGVLVEAIDREIVVTNLVMQSFPIIRYQLGDYMQLAAKEKQCKCGMQHQIIEEITGRIGETVMGKESTYPSLYFYYIFKNLSKKGLNLNYLVVQEQPGFLQFYIEQLLSDAERLELNDEILKYFNNDISYTTIEGNFSKEITKKTVSFISKIKA